MTLLALRVLRGRRSLASLPTLGVIYPTPARQTWSFPAPLGYPGANLKSISHIC